MRLNGSFLQKYVYRIQIFLISSSSHYENTLNGLIQFIDKLELILNSVGWKLYNPTDIIIHC